MVLFSAPREVAWRRFLRRQPTLVIGLAVLLLILASGVLAPVWWTGDPQQMRPAQRLQPPSDVRWFGSDHFGRDAYTRRPYGSRRCPACACAAPITSAATSTRARSTARESRSSSAPRLRCWA